MCRVVFYFLLAWHRQTNTILRQKVTYLRWSKGPLNGLRRRCCIFLYDLGQDFIPPWMCTGVPASHSASALASILVLPHFHDRTYCMVLTN
ncbi:hypothetical protein H4582DRAFT_1966707, partial [Lactarius indigo]